MNCIFSAGGDHDSLAEKEKKTLMDCITRYNGSSRLQNGETIKAVGAFLSSRGGAAIPWFRMYEDSPKCTLLNQELKKEDVLQEGVMVFCTLVKDQSRKALNGGTWCNKGGETIYDQFFIKRLYYDDGQNMQPEKGFTVVEFTLKKGPRRKGQVAICVLHQKGYVHLIRDLRRDADKGKYSGENQANNRAVQHHLAQINSAPTVDAYGSVNGSQVLQMTNLVSNISESVMYPTAPGHYQMNMGMYGMTMLGNSPATESSAGPNQANQLTPINPAPTIVDGFVNGCQVVGHTINPASNSESAGYQSIMHDRDWENFSAMNVGYHPAPEDYAMNQSNTYRMNGGLYHTTLKNMATSAGNHLSLQNYTMNPSNTWPMIGGTYDMTSENITMSVGGYLASQNYMMNPPNTWPMTGSMCDVTSDNIDMTVGNYLAPETYTMHPPNTWSMNGGMHDI